MREDFTRISRPTARTLRSDWLVILLTGDLPGPLLRAHRRLIHRLELPEIRVLNLAAVEREIVFEHNIHRGAA